MEGGRLEVDGNGWPELTFRERWEKNGGGWMEVIGVKARHMRGLGWVGLGMGGIGDGKDWDAGLGWQRYGI